MRTTAFFFLLSLVPTTVVADKTPVTVQPDGLYICEAEEFQPAGKNDPGWQAKRWGENYYAATFANSFLSRKAFLGAPEQCDATINLNSPWNKSTKRLN